LLLFPIICAVETV